MAFVWILICGAIIGIDQFTKSLAVKYLPHNTIPLIDNVLELKYVENSGAAWGMFSEHRWIFMVVSTVAIVGIIIFMIVCRKKYYSVLLYLSLSFIVGGGIANMIDRIFRTSIYDSAKKIVVDFIYFKPIDFPVFNVADSFVTVGAVLVIVYVITSDLKDRKKEKEK